MTGTKAADRAERIRRIWGERCPDFDPMCPTCRRWLKYDRDFGIPREMTPEERLVCEWMNRKTHAEAKAALAGRAKRFG